ncbi:hypothetical protein L209DRAFT_557096 [Thermothelomyces heterothallicus CBS 203.75]
MGGGIKQGPSLLLTLLVAVVDLRNAREQWNGYSPVLSSRVRKWQEVALGDWQKLEPTNEFVPGIGRPIPSSTCPRPAFSSYWAVMAFIGQPKCDSNPASETVRILSIRASTRPFRALVWCRYELYSAYFANLHQAHTV